MERESEKRGAPALCEAPLAPPWPGILLGRESPLPAHPSMGSLRGGGGERGGGCQKARAILFLVKVERLLLGNPALSVSEPSSFGPESCPGRWPGIPAQPAATQPQSSSLSTTLPQSSTQASFVALSVHVILLTGSHSWVENLPSSSYFLAQRESLCGRSAVGRHRQGPGLAGLCEPW